MLLHAKKSMPNFFCNNVIPQLSIEEMKNAQNRDPVINRFKNLKSEYADRPTSKQISGELDDVRHFWHQWSEYNVQNDILYCISTENV